MTEEQEPILFNFQKAYLYYGILIMFAGLLQIIIIMQVFFGPAGDIICRGLGVESFDNAFLIVLFAPGWIIQFIVGKIAIKLAYGVPDEKDQAGQTLFEDLIDDLPKFWVFLPPLQTASGILIIVRVTVYYIMKKIDPEIKKTTFALLIPDDLEFY